MTLPGMMRMLTGYARVSTAHQDVAHRAALHALEVAPERLCVDKGLSGAIRERPGLTTALAICRPGDTRRHQARPARPLAADARDISAEFVARDALTLGGAGHDSADPVGRLLFIVLGMVAKFERDLLGATTREGMAIARQGPAERPTPKAHAGTGTAPGRRARSRHPYGCGASRPLWRRPSNRLVGARSAGLPGNP